MNCHKIVGINERISHNILEEFYCENYFNLINAFFVVFLLTFSTLKRFKLSCFEELFC